MFIWDVNKNLIKLHQFETLCFKQCYIPLHAQQCVSRNSFFPLILLINSVLYLSCKLLQPPNVNGTFLWSIQVASSHTEVGGRTYHSTCQAEGVVRKYSFSCTIVVLKMIKCNHTDHCKLHPLYFLYYF